MEGKLRLYLEDVFSRSLSAISIRARHSIEVPLEVEGRRRKADIYEAYVKGTLFNLAIRKTIVHKSIGKGEIEENIYELDGSAVSPFALEEIIALLGASGYEVPSYLEGPLDPNLPIEKTLIHRKDKGVRMFFDNLKTKKIESVRLVLSYDASGEGSFCLDLLVRSPRRIDTGNLEHLDLGFLDYYKEVSEEKKKALIRYLQLLSSFNMYAGLENMDLVDYYTFIERMQEEKGKDDYVVAVEKHRLPCADSPAYGGEGYLSFGVTLSPMDFAWYMNGFHDTREQRKAFFAYYDEKMKLEKAREERSEKEYYLSLLGLGKDASFDDVAKAHKSMALKFHPDRIASYDLDKEFMEYAKSRMQTINEAYEWLRENL